MNAYVELKNAFAFMDCAARKGSIKKCTIPANFQGRPTDGVLRDYVYSLLLVASVSRLEYDIAQIEGVPNLKKARTLSSQLVLLRDHFSISTKVYEAVDRIRTARNLFVHDGEIGASAGCSKNDVPGHMATFLQHCRHPDYV